jgi:hypothetical protein
VRWASTSTGFPAGSGHDHSGTAGSGRSNASSDDGDTGDGVISSVGSSNRAGGENVKASAVELVRLNRRIADGLLCSRREADAMLREGRVMVNGVLTVDGNAAVRDVVTVDGKVVPGSQRQSRIWIVHKLKGELVTYTDPEGRPVIMDRVVEMGLPRGLKYVGE